jgi:hypothetical protein
MRVACILVQEISDPSLLGGYLPLALYEQQPNIGLAVR